MPQLLYSMGKIPLHPLNKRMVALQSRSECFGEAKNLLPLQENKPDSLIL
jgi:hypothetical protein